MFNLIKHFIYAKLYVHLCMLVVLFSNNTVIFLRLKVIFIYWKITTSMNSSHRSKFWDINLIIILKMVNDKFYVD